jgi:hypothetical protein
VQVLEVEPVAIASHAIAGPATRHLDLDRLRTPIDELPDAGRASPGAGQVEDFETGQWQ